MEYEVIAGDGLKEGTDFKIQSSHRSPLTFDPGSYSRPIRVIWYKSSAFDPSKDNTLTIRLTGCSDPSIILGYPGPSKKFSQHVVTKINDD